MSSTLPRPTSNAPTWHDHDQFSGMNRSPLNNQAASSHAPLAVGPGQGRVRNGYAANGGDKAVPVPGSSTLFGNGVDRSGGMTGRAAPILDMARSPPNPSSKNTKHVPCKFFRQGACQAGNACPFSHSLDPMTQQAPCKYFMKGNCKFGAKCALAHYLPDGRRVNRADLDVGMAMGARPFNFGNRGDQPPFRGQDAGLSEPIIPPQPYGPDYFPSQVFPLIDSDEPDAFQDRYNQYPNPGALDSGLSSPPASQFGSPPNDYYQPKSPVGNLRTALNAPLPQSFDANGVSHIAKYGPLGQSVPDKFGLRSPASSSLSRHLGSPPELILSVRNANLASNLRNASPLGLSPQNAEESIGQRIMHSQRSTKVRGLSASLPRASMPHDWEEGFGLETDLLPNSLHDEVLTPQERMRRLSRPDQHDSASRDHSSGLAIPSGTSSKVGSPPTGGSPSRFSALWAEQREKKAAENNGASAFGHVGSPLRESWMPSQSSEGSHGVQLSGISQAMARMQLNRTELVDSNGGPKPQATGWRHSSAPVGRLDRTLSSPGLSSKKIDEEVEGVFTMDGEERPAPQWSGQSPGLTPLRDKSNGDVPKVKRESVLGPENGLQPVYGFRP